MNDEKKVKIGNEVVPVGNCRGGDACCFLDENGEPRVFVHQAAGEANGCPLSREELFSFTVDQYAMVLKEQGNQVVSLNHHFVAEYPNVVISIAGGRFRYVLVEVLSGHARESSMNDSELQKFIELAKSRNAIPELHVISMICFEGVDFAPLAGGSYSMRVMDRKALLKKEPPANHVQEDDADDESSSTCLAGHFGSYGLDIFAENENYLMGLFVHVCKTGARTQGYSPNWQTFDLILGDVQFFGYAKKENEQYKFDSLEVHCTSPDVWEMACTGIDLTDEKVFPPTSKLLIMRSAKDDSGMVPIHLFRADVLPCFLEGEKIKVQVVAAAVDVSYFADQEEYENSFRKEGNGKCMLIANNTLFPVGFLVNHQVRENETSEDRDFALDDVCMFAGTVKKIFGGKFGDTEGYAFIRIVIDTPYGELRIAHAINRVPEDKRDLIKVGSVVFGQCVLTGDVGIFEYEKGFVKDFEHHLRLMRDVFQRGEVERIKSVFTEDALYVSETTHKEFYGIDGIVEKFSEVRKAKVKCYAYLATVTESRSYDVEEGTRCIALAYDKEDNFEALCFLTLDENEMIEKMKVTPRAKYGFRLD